MGWRRTFWAVWVANLVTAAGMMSFLPFFPSHLEELGLTERAQIATWAGIVYGAAPLAAAFMSPVWGALGDRYGRRLMVLRSMLAITVFVGAMAFVTSPWQLLLLRLMQGVFSGFVAPSMTLVSISAPEDQQGRTAGSLHMAMTLGAVLGPALGELLRAQTGIRSVYMAVAALSFVGAALVGTLATEDASKRRTGGPGASVRAVLRETAREIGALRSHRGLRAAVVLLFWIQFGMGATNPLLELYVRDLPSHVGWLVPSTAALFSVMAVANLAGQPLWGSYGDRHGHYPALVRCALWSGGALVLHALAPGYEILLVARVVLGAAMAGSGPLAFGVAAVETGSERRGGAFGVVFAARALAISLSAIVGGALSGWLGIRGLFLAGGALVFLSLWRLRRAELEPEREPAPPGA